MDDGILKEGSIYPRHPYCRSNRVHQTGASPFFAQPEMGSVRFRAQTIGRRPLPSAARVRPGAHSARRQDSRNDLTPCRIGLAFHLRRRSRAALRPNARPYAYPGGVALRSSLSLPRFPVLLQGIGMITDTEIKIKGFQILAQYLGDIEAERFIALIQRESFDYTEWRQDMDEELSLEEISRKAMALRNKNRVMSELSRNSEGN